MTHKIAANLDEVFDVCLRQPPQSTIDLCADSPLLRAVLRQADKEWDSKELSEGDRLRASAVKILAGLETDELDFVVGWLRALYQNGDDNE